MMRWLFTPEDVVRALTAINEAPAVAQGDVVLVPMRVRSVESFAVRESMVAWQMELEMAGEPVRTQRMPERILFVQAVVNVQL